MFQEIIGTVRRIVLTHRAAKAQDVSRENGPLLNFTTGSLGGRAALLNRWCAMVAVTTACSFFERRRVFYILCTWHTVIHGRMGRYFIVFIHCCESMRRKKTTRQLFQVQRAFVTDVRQSHHNFHHILWGASTMAHRQVGQYIFWNALFLGERMCSFSTPAPYLSTFIFF